VREVAEFSWQRVRDKSVEVPGAREVQEQKQQREREEQVPEQVSRVWLRSTVSGSLSMQSSTVAGRSPPVAWPMPTFGRLLLTGVYGLFWHTDPSGRGIIRLRALFTMTIMSWSLERRSLNTPGGVSHRVGTSHILMTRHVLRSHVWRSCRRDLSRNAQHTRGPKGPCSAVWLLAFVHRFVAHLRSMTSMPRWGPYTHYVAWRSILGSHRR